MWSISLHRPLGSLSARRLTLFVSVILVALFATVLANITPVQAQTPTMATWSGEDIRYKEDDWNWEISLTKSDNPKSDNHVPDLTGSPCENSPNAYYSPIGTFGNDKDSSWLYVICLSYPHDGSDKTQPIPAMFLQYNAPYGTENAREFRLQGSRVVHIAAEGTDSHGNPIENTETITSCDSDFTHGLGWIVCPVTNLLADGMDQLYKILSSFLTVAPLTTDRSGILYYIWGVMQNFANVLFIAAFLIIIYSQTTNVGLSNYGIKRLLPRLIIAAVLVNVSYWICAVAVDLSNLLGVHLQNLFIDIRNNIPKDQVKDLPYGDWKALAVTILGGGAALGGLVGGLVASAGASLWFLLVALVGAMVSALVAILILAARQAIITILIILSPLAFVAYLLPSTEKYFDRWKDIFMTMLIMFPMFSLVFGGASLAGLAIIYSADSESTNYYNIIILGMLVQVAPVIITPLLIRLGGSILGRVAGIVNDPNKGVVDGTRKYAQKRHDMTKSRQLWARDEHGNLKNNNPLALGGRRIALRGLHQDHQLKAWQAGADATYKRDSRYHEAHQQEELNTLNNAIGEQAAKRDFAREVARNNELRKLDIESRLRQDEASLESDRNSTYYEALKARPGIANAAIRDLADDAQNVSSHKKSEQYRKDAVNRVQDDNYHGTLANNEAMQREAGYQEVDEYGPLRVRATALSKIAAASGDRIKNYSTAYSVDNVPEADIIQLALGHSAAGIEINEEAQEAAIQHIIESGHVEPMITLNQQLNLTASGSTTIRKAFASAMKASSLRPKYIPTSQLNDAIPQGLDPLDPTNYGNNLVHKWITTAVTNHKYDVGGLSSTDPDDINFIQSVFSDNTNGVLANLSTVRNETGDLVIDVMRNDIKKIFKDEKVYNTLGNRADPLRRLARTIGGFNDDDLRPAPPRRD